MEETEEDKDLLDKAEDRPTRFQSFQGIVATFVGEFLFILSGACVQLLKRRIPDFELSTFRNGIPLILYTIVVLATRKWPVIKRDKIGVTFLYTVVTFTNGFLLFVSITFLPASTVSSVVITSVITFGLIIFSLFADNRVTVKTVLFAALCVGGVILVIQPWSGYSEQLTDAKTETQFKNIKANETVNVTKTRRYLGLSNENIKLVSTGILNMTTTTTMSLSGVLSSSRGFFQTRICTQMIGYGSAVLCGVTFDLDVLMVKRNPYFNEDKLEVIFWIYFTNTIYSTIFIFIIETPVLPSNWFDSVLVIVHGLMYAAIWPLYIYGPKYISGHTVSAIISTQVVMMLIFQYTVLSSIHPGHRNWMEVMGAILVLVGSAASSVFEMFRNKKEDSQC